MGILQKLWPRKNGQPQKEPMEKQEDEENREYTLRGMLSTIPQMKKELIKGVYHGDARAWYRFCMGWTILFMGIMLIVTIFVDFFMELQTIRKEYHEARPVVARAVDAKLAPGSYAILNVLKASTVGYVRENETVLMLSGPQGGAVIAVPLPEGMPLPKEWYGIDSYTLQVTESGEWHFIETSGFNKRKKEAEKRQAEFEKHMKSGSPAPFARN